MVMRGCWMELHALTFLIKVRGILCLFALLFPFIIYGQSDIEVRDSLSASYVSGHIDRNHNRTQTGLTRFDSDSFYRGYAVFSAPDVLKTLQVLTGVAPGTELLSNLYVHGGDGSDNLYLLDGVPLYQICHLGGVFSAFNTDIIENLDFYKSGFPARFGGRTSSVVDIKTKDGDFSKYGGSWSLGLLEGRANVNGPIVRGKTSFNVALRRSWADALIYPISKLSGKTAAYSFVDFNASLKHMFTDYGSLSASFYYGGDNLLYRHSSAYDPEFETDADNTSANLSWGNMLASATWENTVLNGIGMTIRTYWSGNHSKTKYVHSAENAYYKINNNLEQFVALNDIGLTADFHNKIGIHQTLRYGLSAIYHGYNPEWLNSEYYEEPSGSGSLRAIQDSTRTAGGEFSIYIEDEAKIADWLTLNIGVRDVIYNMSSFTWNSFEPRIAAGFYINNFLNVKISYSKISQFSHLLSTLYLDMPASCWMPSSPMAPPMQSQQISGGIYSKPFPGLHVNLEGWWKTIDNLIEYAGINTLLPPLSGWENSFNLGSGRSRGIELDVAYETQKLSLNAFYTLSWSQRLFEDIWPDWYPDRNDNRHKFTFMANWRPDDKYEFYLAWNYHSGNHMTVPSQYVPQVYFDTNKYSVLNLFEAPNNVSLPDYHRLDAGVNIHTRTRKGREAIWNISVYNVYCRINPLFATIRESNPSRDIYSIDIPHPVRVASFIGSGVGIIPILPSFSYTCKF